MQKVASLISSCHWHELTVRSWPDAHCIILSQPQLEQPLMAQRARAALQRSDEAALTLRELAHGVLLWLLAPLCQRSPQSLEIARDRYGKPFLPHYPHIQFNLSHTQGAVAFAFAEGIPVGVDVERCQGQVARKRAIAQRFFHPDEQHELATLDDRAFLPAFIQLWSHKEAYLKALGMGLRKPLSSFRCLRDPHGELCVWDNDERIDCVLTDRWVYPGGVTETFDEALSHRSAANLSAASENTPASWVPIALTCCLSGQQVPSSARWRLVTVTDTGWVG
ncbi:4'-phosphopantetheinyl transferase family protein [Dickeya lacustris]|uniref:4'-phosphopantetheinyl transferase superfamily protein n=1 Tax=Dickeya lacustris TaxID=2259638 RepID=A0ABY8G3I1_9GAMM|nr:4'-phosphopantetheinyl transferase superfamily protein [Dickeya lacustris]WFN54479.1 4'-phosphopantetheinyl transferase superfamily protein [Dickeya lacustris]